MEKQLPVWASIALIVAVSAVLLTATHLVTGLFKLPEGVLGKDTPEGEAMPAAEQFLPVEIAADTGLDNCYEGRSGGQTLGYTAQVTVSGYGGPIELVVGMDMNGLLTGISVDGAQFNETPGLGAKSKDPEFKDQFVGIATPVGLATGDATSGATQSGDWAAEPDSGAAGMDGAPSPAVDATSSATENGDWATMAAPTAAATADAIRTPAPEATEASAVAAVTGTTAVGSQPAATRTPAPEATEASAVDAMSSATEGGDWEAETQTPAPEATEAPAVDAMSSATEGGDWAAATQTPAPESTEAPAVQTASAIDAISGATITSTAVVNGVNLCAEFLKTLLTSGNG